MIYEGQCMNCAYVMKDIYADSIKHRVVLHVNTICYTQPKYNHELQAVVVVMDSEREVQEVIQVQDCNGSHHE